MAAVANVPLTDGIGPSTDAVRCYLVKSRVSQALDASAWADGRRTCSPTTDDDIRIFCFSNSTPGCTDATLTGPQISVDANSTTVTISVAARLPTIPVQEIDGATQGLRPTCASKPGYFFRSPISSDLAVIFQTTATQLSNLRLAH